MTAGQQNGYCLDLIARHDEDLRLSLPYATDADRPRLLALFAFHIEIRRAPALVSEPPLGEIRLQWWREALDEAQGRKAVRAHPVVEALADARAVDAGNRADFERLIDARARLFYEPGFRSVDDLTGFLKEAEAPLARLAVGAEASESLEAFALGHALSRFAPHLAPSLADPAAAAAREILDRSRNAVADLSPAAAGAVAYLALARGYLARGAGGWPLAKRLTLFASVLSGRF